MQYTKRIVAALTGSLFALPLLAAPTAEEAAQLGNTLTPLGAIKAGNKDGTIPAWDGGLCKPPADYKPTKGEQGGTPYVDPYAGDKPLYKITAADVAKYADKLDEGAKELFKRFPQSFRIDVYPTHRSACFPNWIYENTIKNVMKPKIVWTNGTPGLTEAHAQVPFPIPKNGVEVMWNSMTRPGEWGSAFFNFNNYLIGATGELSHVATNNISLQNLYWDRKLTAVPDSEPFWAIRATESAPASHVGIGQLRWSYLRPDLRDPPTWAYIPGQRRVRLAPDFSYDGVATSSGGVLLYDEINGFDGKMDRYDFKLLGRKELLVPYNAYKYWTAPTEQLAGPRHVNPDNLRWELHRVWVVEANLKAGMRHVQKTKLFYLDEDSWAILAYVGLDGAGKPHHYMQFTGIQLAEKPKFYPGANTLYEFNKGMYSLQNRMGEQGLSGVLSVPPYRSDYFTAEAMAGAGVR